MNWSRVKTILIAMLLAVNIFLLVTYIMRDNEVRRDEMTVRSDVRRILAAQGIYVDESIIPLDSVEIRPALLLADGDEEKTAKRLFGSPTKNPDSSGTTFSGDGGSIMFSGGMFSLVYESGKSIESIADAAELARSIAAKLGISVRARELECHATESGYVVGVPSILSGVHVFDCDAEMRISGSGSVIASGKFIGDKLRTVSGEVISTSALMLSFADHMKESGTEMLEVSGIELGYVSESQTAGHISLVPTIKFTTGNGVFYVDMQTGLLCEI